MKLVLSLLGLFLMLPSNSPRAQKIGLYSDASLTSCAVMDTVPGTFEVYVVLEDFSGETGNKSMGIAFSMRPGCNGTNVQWLSDDFGNQIYYGDTQNGVGIVYACQEPPILLATVTYYGNGTSWNCACLETAEHPIEQTSWGVGIDCAFEKHSIGRTWPYRLYINPDETCDYCTLPVAVSESNWGVIKALYQPN